MSSFQGWAEVISVHILIFVDPLKTMIPKFSRFMFKDKSLNQQPSLDA